MGFLAGFCAWWPGVLVMIATGDAVVALIQQFNSSFLSEPWQQGVVIILVLAFSFILSILRFRATQNLVNTIFVAYGGAILLIGLSGVLALFTGHTAPVDYSPNKWVPSPATYTFYGTVILGLLGVEVPLNMGVEINNVRAITRYLLWGSIVVIIAYLIGTFGVMTAVPIKDQGSPAAVTEAVQVAFGAAGPVLGFIVNVIFIGFFLFNTAVYNYSFGRLLFVSGLDRRLPAVVSKVNRNKVPWVAVLVQSIIAAIITALTFIIVPYAIKTGFRAQNLSTDIYWLLQAAVTVIWCISMVILFVDVIIIRRKFHETFSRIRLAPDWVFYLCSVLGLLASAVGVVVIFTAPWTSTGDINLQQWQLLISSIAILSILVGVILYFVGERASKSEVTDEEIIAQVTS
jgi:amino acid transporter